MVGVDACSHTLGVSGHEETPGCTV
jgi:hypothetical protein